MFLVNGDSYSLLTPSGTTLTTNNASGLSRLRYGWNDTSVTVPMGSFDSTAWYKIICRQSNKSLDVNSSSTTGGTGIVQWDYWGGNNQQWKILDLGFGYFEVIKRNSGQSLAVNRASTSNGADVIQWPWNGGRNQQWQIVQL